MICYTGCFWLYHQSFRNGRAHQNKHFLHDKYIFEIASFSRNDNQLLYNKSSRENDEEYKEYNNYDEGDYDNDDYDEESNDNEEKRDNKTIDTSINKAN